MDQRYLERNIRVREATLGRGVFQGNWVQILEEMMEHLGVKVPVGIKIMSFYDGTIRAKYRVALILPKELEVGTRMPYGEARHVETAFQIAILEAITEIRTKRFKNLEGTQFHSLPSDYYRRETEVDHLAFTKTNPVETALYLDSCMRLIRTYHRTYKMVTEELESLIESYTDPAENQERRRAMEYEAACDHHEPPSTPQPYIHSVTYEPETPVFQFTSDSPPHIFAFMDAEELIEPEIPDCDWENEVEPYAGTESDPILFVDSDDEGIVNPRRARNMEARVIP